MRYLITYSAIATLEYEEATAWYKERSLVAAERFVSFIERKLADISSHPYQYKRVYKKFYEVSVSVYPYTIVYLINEKAHEIIIVAIYHHKRNPKKKYRR